MPASSEQSCNRVIQQRTGGDFLIIVSHPGHVKRDESKVDQDLWNRPDQVVATALLDTVALVTPTITTWLRVDVYAS